MTDSLRTIVSKFYDEYMSGTPSKLKIIDAYLTYVLLTGVVQFAYCGLVGTFPFNSFLSGFISCVGSFVLAGELCVMGENCRPINIIITKDHILPDLWIHGTIRYLQAVVEMRGGGGGGGVRGVNPPNVQESVQILEI